MEYTEKKFDLPKLEGISEKQIEVHLGLYAGYVKHVNLLREKINESSDTYTKQELRRRFAFEFDGMRMHEYYFEQFEGGQATANDDSTLIKELGDKYGDFDGFMNHFIETALSRGIGWTVLYWDPVAKTPHVAWTGDHEVGTLAGLPILLALDMWEHAFMVDYVPSEKKTYVESFFKNLNWSVVEQRFENT